MKTSKSMNITGDQKESLRLLINELYDFYGTDSDKSIISMIVYENFEFGEEFIFESLCEIFGRKYSLNKSSKSVTPPKIEENFNHKSKYNKSFEPGNTSNHISDYIPNYEKSQSLGWKQPNNSSNLQNIPQIDKKSLEFLLLMFPEFEEFYLSQCLLNFNNNLPDVVDFILPIKSDENFEEIENIEDEKNFNSNIIFTGPIIDQEEWETITEDQDNRNYKFENFEQIEISEESEMLDESNLTEINNSKQIEKNELFYSNLKFLINLFPGISFDDLQWELLKHDCDLEKTTSAIKSSSNPNKSSKKHKKRKILNIFTDKVNVWNIPLKIKDNKIEKNKIEENKQISIVVDESWEILLDKSIVCFENLRNLKYDAAVLWKPSLIDEANSKLFQTKPLDLKYRTLIEKAGFSFYTSGEKRIDLHGIRYVPATDMIKSILKAHKSIGHSKRLLEIVTGRGLHSVPGSPIIKNFIIKLLKDKSCRWVNPGMVQVLLN